MPKITFFEIEPWEKDYLKKKLKGNPLRFLEEPLGNGNAAEARDSDIISVFIHSNISRDILKKLPKLKSIATRSTGFDHIDIAECKKRGIAVCNVPYYGENTVAEHTFALILSLSRNIHKSYVRTLKNDFSISGLTGFDLKGKTIGIVGGGDIGLHVARIAKSFGMKVLVSDIKRQDFLAEVIGFDYASFDGLLEKSDIVSLHVPYSEKTHHLINKKSINKMKKGAILINTSRGGVVDTDALLSALESKQIGGAGLDVIEGEEWIKEEEELLHETGNPKKLRAIVRDHKIFKMENVVFTPHNAFNSKEALIRILDTTAGNIEAYIRKSRVNEL